MKNMFLSLVIVMGLSSTANADFTVKIVPPMEAVKSAGNFVLDTGKKVCEGVTTTIFGIGETVTAPFRADTYRPKKKTYYFKTPKLIIEYQRGRLEKR
tara:strand:+ start:674 stop:967 length:294 start_codon:yes stop_codon:yes gene_type:complete